MINIYDYLKNNEYPGRGIFIGTKNGQDVVAYFIMGRSVNSRNRIFVKEEDTLFTKAYDESKVADPSLIIYNAVRSYKNQLIVTNGNQTDTIYEYLKQGKTYEEALETREYEPDAPNFTPRISALISESEYVLSILRKNNEGCERLFYPYEKKEGVGHFISTYDHNGDPLPSFSSEPLCCEISDDFPNFAEKLWESLNNENKISLYVRMGNDEKIFNKNQGD